MLPHPTLDHLKALRLDGMAEAFAELQAQDAAADLSHTEWLGLLVDREVASRETKRFEARMRSARLRHVGACPEDVDYRARRGLDKALFQSLLSGKWITDKRNLIITGPCGVGKTWLGCALAQAACRDGVTVVYKRMPRLFEELEMAHGDGRFPRLFRSITKAQLLILDDWGPDRLTATQRRDLMEIVEERYGRGSPMIPASCPSQRGTTSSASPPSPTPSWIASSTTPIAWSSKASPCGKPSPKWMTKRLKPDTQIPMPHGNASQVGGCSGTSGRMLSE
jgi:DNA replication protein DnaC